MTISPIRFRRRGLLALGLASATSLPTVATTLRGTGRPLVVGQLFDTSAAEQDVARDFLIGSRAAWQDLNSRGGLRGRPVQHLAVEVDGTREGARSALQSLSANPDCVGLCGTVSDPIAVEVGRLLPQVEPQFAHIAPWLQNSAVEIDERTFPIFAGRQEQIAHALKSLSVMGVQEVGAVFASAREEILYQRDVAGSAAALRLKLSSFRGAGNLAALGQSFGPRTPALLLFLGGTPELVQFTLGLDRQARQRYVIGLGEVNLQTVLQMGHQRATPIVAAQPVPLVSSALPVVRDFRSAMSRFFDEPPVALSLAGFISARYAQGVLRAIEGAITRASVLAAFQRRADADVDGFRVSYDENRRSVSFVTQSMLTADGRVVG